jgi:AraC-like DNA-binding protein
MSMVFRAADEPAASRPDYWRYVINERFRPMEVRFADGPGSHDELLTGVAGALRVTESTSSAGEVHRTSKHVSSSDPELYQLVAQARGSIVGEHLGRQAELSPGDLGLLDLSSPLRCVHEARRSVFVTFPLTLTPFKRSEVARLAGTRIPGDRGTAALVSSLVRQLPRRLGDDDGVSAAQLGTAVLDLLTVMLGARIRQDSPVPSPARQRALLASVHAFVEEHLGDPGLSPGVIAAAHHISVRYLHKLFETEDRSVAALIRRRRLDRSRRDLLDPALAARPVSATAARWGFVSAAHFHRAFRDAYGLPPGEFRLAYASQGNETAAAGPAASSRPVAAARSCQHPPPRRH